jgi:hypothetical protein
LKISDLVPHDRGRVDRNFLAKEILLWGQPLKGSEIFVMLKRFWAV